MTSIQPKIRSTLRKLVRVNLWYHRQPEWNPISQGLWSYVMDDLEWHVTDRTWIDPIYWEFDAVKHETHRKTARRTSGLED